MNFTEKRLPMTAEHVCLVSFALFDDLLIGRMKFFLAHDLAKFEVTLPRNEWDHIMSTIQLLLVELSQKGHKEISVRVNKTSHSLDLVFANNAFAPSDLGRVRLENRLEKSELKDA